VDNHHDHHHHGTQAHDIPTDRVAVCAVTGDTIDIADAEQLGHFRDIKGKRFYFCCPTCAQLFDKEPEAYADQHLGHEHHHHVPTSGTLRLKEKEHLVDNVWSFRFTTDLPLLWTPGQFIRIEIPHENPDDEGTKRWFTISSTPYDSFIQITTRVTGTSFKQALAALTIGETVRLIEQPDGDFVWQESDKPIVFIAGGIGITPFYSIVKARALSGQPVPAILVYNGRTDDLPFKSEFEEVSTRHPEFTVHYIIGEPLTAERLINLVPDITTSDVYVSGPEPMVETIGKELEENGLHKDGLHQDFFPHYNEANY
jgi:ferredoxin-NADP reductase/YHS domain-containing protein